MAASVLSGCVPGLVGFTPPCVPEGPLIPLPPELHESSGVVPIFGEDGVFWSHNDSGGTAELFAVSASGALLGRVRVAGAENVDWEDLAAGPCPGVEEGRCLYIADTGDNVERRDDPALYRVREPAVGDSVTAPAQRFPLRFPHGPRDVEAIYLLPGERLFLVTKGRNHRVEVYRVPPLEAPGVPLTVERIQRLTRVSPALPRHITGGSASEDGSLLALRSYETLEFFRPDAGGRLVRIPRGQVNLRPLREPQGEAVALLPGGRVVLTSEEGLLGELPAMAFLRCDRVGEGG